MPGTKSVNVFVLVILVHTTKHSSSQHILTHTRTVGPHSTVQYRQRPVVLNPFHVKDP